MKKKMLCVVVAAIMMLMVTACGSSSGSSDSSSSGSDTSDQTIALFMTHMSNEFTVTLSDAVEAEVNELGYKYSVYDAEQDAATQSDQIEQAITLGVEGIIIEPVSVDGIVPAVKAAKEAGVYVVIVNQRISTPEAADCYVGADAATTGAKLMEKVMEDIGSQGNIAELLGPMGSDGQVGRSEGFDSVLAENPDVKVVFSDAADWETDPALTITENWLNAGTDLVAIVSQNDAMAMGAAKAVQDAQLEDQVFVYGVDATSEGLQAVLDGKLKATISQGTEDQGRLAADACTALLQGETVEAETIVENVIYTQENAQEGLDALGK
ncbi:MAG: sugar ABC transporter substrate-binding protein [Lachnospiraceae bacterium]